MGSEMCIRDRPARDTSGSESFAELRSVRLSEVAIAILLVKARFVPTIDPLYFRAARILHKLHSIIRVA